ncbi:MULTISPECIES: nucleotidyltransferase family protein [Leptospira]|nr:MULTISPECIES: nucleotidyltransferase domain-containing protein [Leptospira]MCG6154145.1 nucleotidyltransferase domain-containing protein [Leptospira bandrabouensis]MCG6170111.1 nucleotidyltransferase domain-containing protein [Leptospira sanjuanensis]MCG6195450.1 nucleotidyltransferase domain-containing protein [Leptospira sanjuanensis]MCG6195513.1 nucleotidyltransferase domain-containing protein [Leptospira sanjuanensis]
MNSGEVKDILVEHKQELLNLGVQKLLLFGSVARNENHEGSDVDILVQFHSGKKNFDSFMDLSFRLEDLLNTHVDLLTEESLTKDLRDFILSEAILIEI